MRDISLVFLLALIFQFCTLKETQIVKSSYSDGSAVPQVDTAKITSIRLFDLKPFEAVFTKAEKMHMVDKAVKSAMQENAFVFLENDCYRWDSKTSSPASIGNGLACRLSDFYLIDLDNDEDLDIIYSSAIDQYVNWDINAVYIFQNKNGVYQLHRFPGYLINAEFLEKKNSKIHFKTVVRPCCDNNDFRFYDSELDTHSWAITTLKGATVHKSKVKEDFE
ncbi:hypothetical protein TH61_03255 [Rufibacter sp. DG15C]|uniref:hypothetical protein n=1 Tax=Rufibacter sp. DG15C TaxID=1379909 RepID=UPI00078C5B01|nr:hypothetical protein [Rufibacter sp. DG15C]AMM50395.1 hypothetical protein TH61_03255 [Rufibacter sp. DG15C]